LNISFERAVDYLKDKGIAIEANPNTKISDDVYNVLCRQRKRGFKRSRRREKERERGFTLREKEVRETQTRRRSSETAARSCKSESYSWTCSSRVN
jgi:translation initiation factor IF-2